MIGSKPPMARQHCRHYSYNVPYTHPEAGPRCAVGVDLSEPRATLPCMPGGTGCPKRQDWTDEERATWEAWQAARQLRMIAAIGALPALGPREGVTIECPNCQGRLRYDRTLRRAYVQCETEHCVRFEAALRGSEPWPAR